MKTPDDLASKSCEPCKGGVPALSLADATAMMTKLHADWDLDDKGNKLTRTFKYKGFAKAVYQANLAAWLADQEGHHPDISFGWGYCTILFTTHDIDGLSENDFICAAKLDDLVRKR